LPVFDVDGGGEQMHASVLLLLILLGVPPYAELLANNPLESLDGIFLDVAAQWTPQEVAFTNGTCL
jgi:hypothetical protein